MQVKTVGVVSSDDKILANCKEYKARKLLTKNRAKIVSYEPFVIKIRKKREDMVNPLYVNLKGQEAVNLTQCSSFHRHEDQVQFLFDSVFSKKFWQFKSADKAEEVNQKLLKLVEAKEFTDE